MRSVGRPKKTFRIMSSIRPGPDRGSRTRVPLPLRHVSSRPEDSMNTTKTLNYALLCTAAVGALMLARPAMAQSDTQIQSIEKQIKALQGQLGEVKANLVTRDRALKAAQQQ